MCQSHVVASAGGLTPSVQIDVWLCCGGGIVRQEGLQWSRPAVEPLVRRSHQHQPERSKRRSVAGFESIEGGADPVHATGVNLAVCQSVVSREVIEVSSNAGAARP